MAAAPVGTVCLTLSAEAAVTSSAPASPAALGLGRWHLPRVDTETRCSLPGASPAPQVCARRAPRGVPGLPRPQCRWGSCKHFLLDVGRCLLSKKCDFKC